MPQYFVTVKEIWERRVLVTAPDEEAAVEKVFNGDLYKEDAFDFDCYLKDDVTVKLQEGI